MKNLKIKIITLAITSLLFPFPSAAQAPSSTHFRLDESQMDFGGGLGTSTNYSVQESIGGVESGKTTSTNFNLFSYFFHEALPGTPGQPTLTNTGGILYSSLDFVISTGGNTSDVNYAIAVSTDNFVTTNFVQTDDTVGATTTWQSYINWGGASGQRLIGLLSNTTYQIKVKARYGRDTETGYSLTASAATVTPNLSVTVAGNGSGVAINSFTTNATTTATSVLFSTLQIGTIKVAAQTITVTTNAVAGYSVSLQQDHDLAKTNGAAIPAVAGTNASPVAWPGPISTAQFGYHTTDSTLCIGASSRFSADNTFAAASTTPYEVSCNTGPASSEVTNIVFKVEVESLQATGNYMNKITYVISPQY